MRRSRLEEVDPNQLLKRKKIYIPYTHLNPAVRHAIPLMNLTRMVRAAATGSIPINYSNPHFIPVGTLLHLSASRLIQDAHERVLGWINQYGLLDTKYEGHYPGNWMNSSSVARTHPIFYLTPRGISFVRETRSEYMRYRAQEMVIGKLGLTPWLWRTYLRPPKAPAPWRQEAKQKLLQWKAKRKEKPQTIPGTQPTHSRNRLRKFGTTMKKAFQRKPLRSHS